ncbi:MAG: hypothetical protein U0Z44_06290 [Kouleothrix sp.]
MALARVHAAAPELDIGMAGLPLLVLRFALAALLAELSYRLIETPFRSGAVWRAWRHLAAARPDARGAWACAGWPARRCLWGCACCSGAQWSMRSRPRRRPTWPMMPRPAWLRRR